MSAVRSHWKLRSPRRTWTLGASLVGLLAFLCLTIVLSAGNEPWKGKPYSEWDKGDIQKVLSSSPWARSVRVDAPWRGQGLLPGNNPPPPVPGASSASPRVGGSEPGEIGGEAEESGEQRIPQATFVIRWYSSRTIREALIRNAILDGKIKQADAEQMLAQPEAGYEILVVGADMTPFEKVSQNELQAAATLQAKASKLKMAASGVQIQRTPQGDKVSVIVFTFPSKQPNGKPGLSVADKSAEFTCILPGFSLRARFDLPKMVDKKGEDL